MIDEQGTQAPPAELAMRFPVQKPTVQMGKHSYPNMPTVYYWGAPNKLVIGNYCSIADGAAFVLGGEHPKASLSTSTTLHQLVKTERCKGDIVVGHDVWIGCNATILSGVTIGTGAIIGAGAVVSKDVSPYAVIVGNPQRIQRFRFDEPTIAALLASHWWDMDPDELNPILKECDSVPNFLARLKQQQFC